MRDRYIGMPTISDEVLQRLIRERIGWWAGLEGAFRQCVIDGHAYITNDPNPPDPTVGGILARQADSIPRLERARDAFAMEWSRSVEEQARRNCWQASEARQKQLQAAVKGIGKAVCVATCTAYGYTEPPGMRGWGYAPPKWYLWTDIRRYQKD